MEKGEENAIEHIAVGKPVGEPFLTHVVEGRGGAKEREEHPLFSV